MKKLVGLSLALALLGSCRSAPTSTLLMTDEVAVCAKLHEGSDGWSLSGVEARTSGGAKMVSFVVQTFVDLDRDGQPGESELRGAIRASVSVPTSRISVSGRVSWKEAGPQHRDDLWLETRVVLDDGTEEISLIPAAGARR